MQLTAFVRGHTINNLNRDNAKNIPLLFINEANELFWEDWQQLIFRTNGRIIIDYNPSDEFHWIYEKLASILQSI